MEFGDRFGIAFAGLGLDQHAFLKVGLEQPLQRHEERRAVVAMPVGIAARHDLGIVDLHFNFGIARQRRIERVEQQITVEAVARRHEPRELEFQVLVVVELALHGCLRDGRGA